MKKISPGIFRKGRNIYTANLDIGNRVYGEKLVKMDKEYREWNPRRSKLGAAIVKGLKKVPVEQKSIILYLGASTGTTPSHLSDITGKEGIVYCVEFAERVFRKLTRLQKFRKNIVPIFADARKDDYFWVEEVDLLYVDVAQPDETEITIRNAKKFLKENGYIMMAVKSQSIDVTKKPEKVYEEEKDKLKRSGFKIVELINLEPYEEKHAMIVARK